MRNRKRIISLALALLVLLGCLSGCGKGPELSAVEVSRPGNVKATGRYVEQTITLPDSDYAMDMVMLSAGYLRVALKKEDGNVLICTAGTQSNTWDTFSLPGNITESGNIESVALSTDGSVFCSTLQKMEDDTYQPHFWFLDASGNSREIPVTYADVNPQKGYFVPTCDFTANGRLLAKFYSKEVREVNPETGELGGNLNELETSLLTFCCAGEDVYMLGWSSGSICRGGVTEALSGVLGEQILSSLQATEGSDPKITFWENSDGYLFFTTHDGLYSYVPGGSVTEELVSGARTSLGDPTFFPKALTGAEDGSFYVLGNQNGESALHHYVYDQNAPTTPDTELRIYSLYEDEDLRQMTSQFQISHPEMAVNLEIGVTGDDGITAEDAIRTLNTQILAGSGPDLICLDGFNLDTYLEKGILADLSDVLNQAGPLLEQVTNCYAQDGKVCAVPTTFAIPAMYGAEKYVSQIHDLDSLVAAAKQAKEENPDRERIVNAMYPITMADLYYDSCSAAWVNPDGTLDAEKLAAFYAAMKELYALDESFRQANAEWMAEFAAEYENGEYYFAPGDYTGLGGVFYIYGDICYLPTGTLDGMYAWSSHVLAGEKDYLSVGYRTIPLSGQASNVFLPRRIMGILTTATHPQAAETFLTFMLSDEVQAKDLTTGFPVNQVTFERELSEDRYVDSVITTGSAVQGTSVSYSAQWPNASQRQQLKGWVDDLTTPALTDRTIRSKVMDQMVDCCNGVITPEQAADAALRSLNLYLSE
ncbi:MAG: ABC transporter substrate-binding protein [Candidatus Faecousia sp.]|nr:ABC transporter substrate-binding protein [Candidatus Faecousia sp.]